MTHSSKRKGNVYEREVVKDLEAAGIRAERAYASNGEALGEANTVDVLAHRPDGKRLRIQAKRRAKIATYLQPPPGCDITVVREDRGESLAVVPLALLIELLR